MININNNIIYAIIIIFIILIFFSKKNDIGENFMDINSNYKMSDSNKYILSNIEYNIIKMLYYDENNKKINFGGHFSLVEVLKKNQIKIKMVHLGFNVKKVDELTNNTDNKNITLSTLKEKYKNTLFINKYKTPKIINLILNDKISEYVSKNENKNIPYRFIFVGNLIVYYLNTSVYSSSDSLISMKNLVLKKIKLKNKQIMNKYSFKYNGYTIEFVLYNYGNNTNNNNINNSDDVVDFTELCTMGGDEDIKKCNKKYNDAISSDNKYLNKINNNNFRIISKEKTIDYILPSGFVNME
jgi:hypothetical protein